MADFKKPIETKPTEWIENKLGMAFSTDYFLNWIDKQSANRSVVQRRLKLDGMRWNIKTGQFIISLTAKYRSGLWERDFSLVRL
jgi:hypothetical protein